MSKKIIKNISVTLLNGKVITTEVDISYGTELFGSDADGNRGVWQDWIEPDYNLNDTDDNGVQLSAEEKKEYEEKLEKELERDDLIQDSEKECDY